MIALLCVLLLLFLFLSAFFSGAETGAYCVNRLRLQLRSERGDRLARRLQRLLEDRQSVLATTLIGTNLANYLTTVCMASALVHLAGDLSASRIELVTTLLLTPIIFVFGEVVPKNWFRQEADRLMLAVSIPLSIADKIFRGCGAVGTLKWLTGKMLRLWHGGDTWEQAVPPRSRMVSLLKEGVADGVLSAEQSKLVDGVLSLSGVLVGAVMIPFRRVATLRAESGRREVLDIIRRYPYRRYPVVGRNRRKVEGLVNVFDFLADPQAPSVADKMSPLITLHPRSSAAVALYRMREAGQGFAVVVDRWGNCIGVVTAKDLVEEIVGDLAAW